MDQSVHFKFTHNGETRRFTVPSSGVRMLDAVKKRVATIVRSKAEDVQLAWRDMDASIPHPPAIPISRPDDLQQAVAHVAFFNRFNEEIKNKPICVYLELLASPSAADLSLLQKTADEIDDDMDTDVCSTAYEPSLTARESDFSDVESEEEKDDDDEMGEKEDEEEESMKEEATATTSVYTVIESLCFLCSTWDDSSRFVKCSSSSCPLHRRGICMNCAQSTIQKQIANQVIRCPAGRLCTGSVPREFYSYELRAIFGGQFDDFIMKREFALAPKTVKESEVKEEKNKKMDEKKSTVASNSITFMLVHNGKTYRFVLDRNEQFLLLELGIRVAAIVGSCEGDHQVYWIDKFLKRHHLETEEDLSQAIEEAMFFVDSYECGMLLGVHLEVAAKPAVTPADEESEDSMEDETVECDFVAAAEAVKDELAAAAAAAETTLYGAAAVAEMWLQTEGKRLMEETIAGVESGLKSASEAAKKRMNGVVTFIEVLLQKESATDGGPSCDEKDEEKKKCEMCVQLEKRMIGMEKNLEMKEKKMEMQSDVIDRLVVKIEELMKKNN